MKNIFIYFSILFLLVGCTQKQKSSRLQKNPIIHNMWIRSSEQRTPDTPSRATYPLGMIQAGPETGNYSWEYCAGYVYGDSLINGFSQTRLNGTGCIDLGDLLIQPFAGINAKTCEANTIW